MRSTSDHDQQVSLCFKLPKVLEYLSELHVWMLFGALVVLLEACGGISQLSNQTTIRVMTYNIHHGVGTDSVFDIDRIGKTIRHADADIVALQDVDRWVDRTDKMDSMTKLADLTGMTYTFAKSMSVGGGENGNGILTRYPILEEKHITFRAQVSNEKRNLIRLVLDVRGTELVFMNTELNGLNDDSVVTRDIAEIVAAGTENQNVPAILAVSMNSSPENSSVAALNNAFQDCWAISGAGNGFTYPSNTAANRLDYIFVSKHQVPTDTKSIEVNLMPVESTVLFTNASDHAPLVVTLKIVSE